MSVILGLLAIQVVGGVHGTVRDAVTGAPITSAAVSIRDVSASTGESGRFMLAARAGDTLRIRRIGYRSARVVIDPSDSVVIRLEPLALQIARMDVRAPGRAATHSAVIDVRTIETEGITSSGELAARIPFVSARSSRGGVAISMRGSRPEQVLVLLDGLPLNDPATGAADMSDLPLAALGEVAVVPGAAAAAFGSGAIGGVIALSSGGRSTVTASAGSYGRAGLSAAHTAEAGGATIRAGGEWSYARNDFSFHNTERAATAVDARVTNERRVNNHERRAAFFGTVATAAAHLTVLASRSERGLVGPMNVRVFDDARGTSDRTLIRIAASPRRWNVAAGARVLRYRYDDGERLVSRTTSLSVDAEAGRAMGPLALRFGGGADRVNGSALESATRPRLFASGDAGFTIGRWRASAAARLDAIADAGARLSPSLGAERPGTIALFARAAQGFRAPAFYDLYFASPQRIENQRSVRAERVVFDGEVGARMNRGAFTASVSLFERETRDAIVWFPGTFSWSPRNVGRERVYGAEVRVTAAREFFDIDLWGSARNTALRLDVDRVTVATPYVPRADGGATARARFGPATVVTSLAAIGRRPIVAIPNPTRAEELPAVALLDLTVSWRAPLSVPDATVSIGSRNIGNTRWQQIAGYPSAGRVWAASIILRPRR